MRMPIVVDAIELFSFARGDNGGSLASLVPLELSPHALEAVKLFANVYASVKAEDRG